LLGFSGRVGLPSRYLGLKLGGGGGVKEATQRAGSFGVDEELLSLSHGFILGVARSLDNLHIGEILQKVHIYVEAILGILSLTFNRLVESWLSSWSQLSLGKPPRGHLPLYELVDVAHTGLPLRFILLRLFCPCCHRLLGLRNWRYRVDVGGK
jgi:hypothetical protein